MSELDDIKARAAKRFDALTMPSQDITGYGPPPTIVSKEHAEAEDDLDRALAIAEHFGEMVRLWAIESGKAKGERDELQALLDEAQVVLDQARAELESFKANPANHNPVYVSKLRIELHQARADASVSRIESGKNVLRARDIVNSCHSKKKCAKEVRVVGCSACEFLNDTEAYEAFR